MFHENHSRTLAKSVTWRIIAFIATLIVLYIFSKDWNMSLRYALVIQVVKFFLYYAHERIWNNSNYGLELKSSKS